MISSNNQLYDFAITHGARRDPAFELIVAFDYYDGPERGLALYPSGVGVRFSSLGDSQSRLFRAFELTTIEGSWWRQVRALQEASKIEPPSRVLVPMEASETLDLLERDVFDAAATGYFIGVGSPFLNCLFVSSVSEEQRAALRQLNSSPASFRLAHQIIKEQKRI